MVDPSTTHPWLTACVAGVTMGVGGLLHEVPARLPSWTLTGAFSALLSRKELKMSLNAEQVKEAVHDAQKLVKLGLEFVPGSTPDEKAANVTNEVKPLFDQAIAALGLPSFAVEFAGKVFGWMVLAEVKAAEAA